jgi:hypothetical protein
MFKSYECVKCVLYMYTETFVEEASSFNESLRSLFSLPGGDLLHGSGLQRQEVPVLQPNPRTGGLVHLQILLHKKCQVK